MASVIKDNKDKGVKGPYEWTKLPRGTFRDVYPTAISSMDICPARHMINKTSMSSYDSFIKSSADAYGTGVHKAIDDGLSFLKKTYNPSGPQVEDVIMKSITHAEESLKKHLPLGENALARPSRAVREMVESYGRRYLATGGKINMLTEQPIRTNSLPFTEQAAGIMDLVMHEEGKDFLEIIDFKYARANALDIGSDFLSALRDPSQQIQPKVYALATFDSRPDINDINFTYDIYHDSGNGKTREQITHKFKRSEYQTLLADVTEAVSRTLATQREYTSLVGGDQQNNALKKIYKVRKGQCTAYACASCPMRYQCSFRTFVEEGRLKANGEKFVDTHLSKMSDLVDPDIIAERSKSWEEYANYKVKQYTDEQIAALQEEYSLTPQAAQQIAESRGQELAKSYQAMKQKYRGLTVDEMKKGALSARSKLAHSILDPEAKARWMTSQLRRNMHDYSSAYVTDLAKTFEMDDNFAREMVLDNVFKDREFVAHLDKMMLSRGTDNLKSMGLDLSQYTKGNIHLEGDFGIALKQYHKTIDKTMGIAVQSQLNEGFARHLLQYGEDVQRQKAGIKPGDVSAKNLAGSLVERNLMSEDPKRFLSTVAKSESFGGVLGRNRLGDPRFPVGTLMIAGMLSYIAGADSVRSVMEGKYNKLKFYLTHNDGKVDDGKHASVYSSSRRLMYSDFGSPVRSVLRRSDMVNRYFKNFREYFRDMVTVATGAMANDEAGSFRKISKSMGVGITEGSKKLAERAETIMNTPGYFAVGVAAGVATFGLLPHLKTDKDIRRDIKDRQKRFKRMKQTHWSMNSPSEEPESQLRMGYKSHTPMGSSIMIDKLMTAVKTISTKDGFMGDMKTFLFDQWNNISARVENVLTKSDLTRTLRELGPQISKKVSDMSVVGGPVKVIADTAKEVKGWFATWYNEGKVGMQTAMRHGREAALKASAEHGLGGQDLKSTIKNAVDQIRQMPKTKILSGKASAMLDISAELSPARFQSPLRSSPEQVRTSSQGDYNNFHKGRDIDPLQYQRRYRSSGMQMEKGDGLGSWYNSSPKMPTQEFRRISDNAPYPNEYQFFETSMAEKLNRVQIPGFVGSRRGTTPNMSAAYPQPNVQSIPAAVHPLPNGHNPRIEDINRLTMNSKQNGSKYNGSGWLFMNKLFGACNNLSY